MRLGCLKSRLGKGMKGFEERLVGSGFEMIIKRGL